jgi:5,10-methylenetetrahydromethanopterin reductase
VDAWLHAFSFPKRTAELARWAEDHGFDGLLVADSQNLNADVWIELALAGAATERLHLGPGVTNPVTRHPAVTASAAATLQAETGGRAVLGLGRGDTALTQIGRRPVPVHELEEAVVAIQGYLGGGIGWIASDGQPKVPVMVAATGPHVIEAAARHADRIDFSVGADAERLRSAVETARGAGREVSLGAFLNVAVHPDRAVARDLVRGNVAIFAGFGGEGEDGDDFVDRFAVVGTADEVAERLNEIAELGIERLVMVPGSLDADKHLVAETNAAFAAEVLPKLR